MVDLTVDAFANKNFTGTVREVRLEPVITANVVTYTTIIDAENNDLKLKPGMTANITIYLQQDSSAQLISAKALSFTPDSSLTRQYQIIDTPAVHSMKSDSATKKTASAFPSKHSKVWVLDGNQIIEKHIVTGMNDNINVQILSGLDMNDKVIEGIQIGAPEADASESGTERSPFMPSRKKPAKKPTTTGN